MSKPIRTIELQKVPQQTIASMNFGTVYNENILAVGSWACSLDVYKCGTADTMYDQPPSHLASLEIQAPSLSVSVDSQNRIVYSGGCDNNITAWAVDSNQSMVIGSHNTPVCSVKLNPQHNVIVSAGWDGFVKYWDVRTNTKQPVAQVQCQGKIYSMDNFGDIVAVACNNKNYGIIDIRNPSAFKSTGVSTLNEDNCYISVMTDSAGFVLASLEGRAEINYFNQQGQRKNFPFRAHRHQSGAFTHCYSMSQLAFHPRPNILVTAGMDGTWTLWDFWAKARLESSERYEQGISSLAISQDGRMLAFSPSYQWHLGANSDLRKLPHRIMIRELRQEDLKKK